MSTESPGMLGWEATNRRDLVWSATTLLVAMALSTFSCRCCHRHESPERSTRDPESALLGQEHSGAEGRQSAPAALESPEELSDVPLFPRDVAASIDLVVVPESFPISAALAVPVMKRLGSRRHRPYLLVAPRATRKVVAFEELVRRLAPANCLMLVERNRADAAPELSGTAWAVIELPRGVTRASLELALRFWGRCDGAVLAIESAEAIIAGSALASCRGVPLLVASELRAADVLDTARNHLGVRRVTLVGVPADGSVVLEDPTALRIDRLSATEALGRLARQIGPDRARSIILCRASTVGDAGGETAWLAPYVSMIRDAPVVLAASADAAEAESGFQAFVAQHRLRPRSAMILADTFSIGEHIVELRKREAPALSSDLGTEAEVDTLLVSVDPLVVPQPGRALSVAVGRIPFHSLPEAACFLVRGFARERLLAGQKARTVMIANPNRQYGSLPLCETVSRATANEIKNARLKVTEFYGVPTTHPEVRDALVEATCIIYEGHLGDQGLFEDPTFMMEANDYGELDEMPVNVMDEPGFGEGWHGVGYGVNADPGWPVTENGEEPLRSMPIVYDCPTAPGLGAFMLETNDYGELAVTQVNAMDEPEFSYARNGGEYDVNTDIAWSAGEDDVSTNIAWSAGEDDGEPLIPVSIVHDRPTCLRPGDAFLDGEGRSAFSASLSERQLQGLPVIILQSCQSLDLATLQRLSDLGCSALVGSSGNVHSASGSTFIKAVVDRILYHDASLGEALCDARNYFFLLQDLKNLRGHREQAKSHRVALSFHLWGDPELRVYTRRVPQPWRPPVSVAWQSEGELVARFPEKRLRSVSGPRYRMRMFPGCEAAGLVKRSKSRASRRILPIQYWRVPAPESSGQLPWGRPRPSTGEARRTVSRLDDQGDFLHVLYFPAGEKANEQVVFHFGE